MNKLVKKAVLVGIGAGLLTKSKLEKTVKKAMKRSGLSPREGKRLARELARQSQSQARKARHFMERELGRALRKSPVNPVTKIRLLRSQLAKLEKTVNRLKKTAK